MASLNVESVALGIHAMPCSNRCRHCWVPGAPGKPQMPYEQVVFVLEQLAALSVRGIVPVTFFYDEPTLHPRFVDIVEAMAPLGLLHEGFALASNGSVLARADDAVWRRLRSAGLPWLQFTLYGMEATHDDFAGRRGAFRDVVRVVERAVEHELGMSLMVVLHGGNVCELAETLAFARGLGPAEQVVVGYVPMQWGGRADRCPRPGAAQYAALPADLRRDSILGEAAAVERILSDEAMRSRPALGDLCGSLTLEVERDLNVIAGGFCDNGGLANLVPALRPVFSLGRLDATGLMPKIEAYVERAPWPVRLLQGTTWGELAERYGDRDNDEVYWLADLPQRKWAAAFLSEALRSRGSEPTL